MNGSVTSENNMINTIDLYYSIFLIVIRFIV